MKKIWITVACAVAVFGVTLIARNGSWGAAKVTHAAGFSGFTFATSSSPFNVVSADLAAGQWLIELIPEIHGGGTSGATNGCQVDVNTYSIPSTLYHGTFRSPNNPPQETGNEAAQAVINLSVETVVSVSANYSGCVGSPVTTSLTYLFFPISASTGFLYAATSGNGPVSVNSTVSEPAAVATLPAGTWLMQDTPNVIGGGGGTDDGGCRFNTVMSGVTPTWQQAGSFRVYVYNTQAAIAEPSYALLNLSAQTTFTVYTSYFSCSGGGSPTTEKTNSVLYKFLKVQPGGFQVVQDSGAVSLPAGNLLMETTPEVLGAGGSNDSSGCTILTTVSGATPVWSQSGSFVVYVYNTQAAGEQVAFSTASLAAPGSVSGYYLTTSCVINTPWQIPHTVFMFFATAPPAVTITPNPSSITAGQSSTLTWSSTNANTCTASGGWSGTKATSGSQAVTPSVTTTYTITCTGAGGSASANATVTVTPPPAGTGTVTVTSENSIVTSTLVRSSWYFPAYPSTDPCSVTPCTGTQSTYPSMPLGTYALTPVAGSAGPTYALRSVELRPVAKRPENFFLSLISDLLRQAEASVVCGFMNTNPSSCPNPTPMLTLATNGDVANFIILWDPVAAISVNPSSVSLNATAGSNTSTEVTLTNSGAQGSTLNWTASSSAPWLTVWPASGCLNAGGKAVNGCSDTNGFQYLTVTANSSGLAAGTYTGTVTFNGTSTPPNNEKKEPQPQTLNVTFTVGAPSGPVVITPNPPSPAPVGTPVPLICSGGTGTYTWTSSGFPTPSTGSGPSYSPSYGEPGTYQVTCTDSSGTSTSTKVTIVAPVCAFGANPQQIVPPGQATLSWSCTNAVTCQLDGAAVATSGSRQVSPTTDTTYTLVCTGAGSGPANTFTAQTTVTTQGPNVREINP